MFQSLLYHIIIIIIVAPLKIHILVWIDFPYCFKILNI